MKGCITSSLTGPTPFLPFLLYDEEAALVPHGIQRRITGIATPKAFLSLLNSSPFSEVMHPSGDWKSEPWVIDGKVMYRGQVRRVHFSDIVRDHTGGDFVIGGTTDSRSENRIHIEEEQVLELCVSLRQLFSASSYDIGFCYLIQHFCRDKTRGKGCSAMLEVRRYILGLFGGMSPLSTFLIRICLCCKHYLLTSSFSALSAGDDPPLCIVARWSLIFDGFNASARLHCGSPSSCKYDMDLKTRYISAYVLYFDVWMRMADRFFRRAALPTLNSALNKKFSSDLLNTPESVVVSGSHPIFVPRGIANVTTGTFCFCDCLLPDTTTISDVFTSLYV